MKKVFLIVFNIICLSKFSIAQKIHVDEEKFISIGGIEQWITIKGDDIKNPVILFLHGGPGSVMSHYSDEMFKEWKKEFTLVKWDQRGAGRTFGKNAPANVNEDYWKENPLTIDRMTTDGLELTDYLVHHLKKEKIIIIGTSWGTVLGARMALQRPDLFHAYISHAQLVKAFDSSTYNKIYLMAKTANDHASIEKLNIIGSPPFNDAKNAGQFLKIIKKYEKVNSIPAPETWWQVVPGYDNEIDSKNREDGDDYSFINFVGHKKLGIKAMLSDVDFFKDKLAFNVPVFFIQGENDLTTPKEIFKRYYEHITAPKKEYFLIPGAAHGFNKDVVDVQYKIIKSLF